MISFQLNGILKKRMLMLAEPQSENAVDLPLRHIHLERLCLDWSEPSSVGRWARMSLVTGGDGRKTGQAIEEVSDRV